MLAMSLWRKLIQAVQTWRRHRGVLRSPKRAGVNLEQLDHRQLLTVTFTGNVFNDFPGTSGPGVAVLKDSSPASHPGDTIPPDIAPFILHSGFDLDALRLVYDPTNDTLDVGFQQPINSAAPPPGTSPTIFGNPVISGDADDNGDDGTVNPNVLNLRPNFIDFPGLQGSETMGITLDLNNDGTPDVVAGIAGDPVGLKTFQVAQAVASPTNPFGAALPQFTGPSHVQNDPQHGAFEFQVTHFSQLFQLETGQALTPQSVIRVGGFAGSANDDGIGEAVFAAQPVNFGVAPTPPPPMVCPPQSPMILVNVHENNHVNTAHAGLVRVSVLGTSGFDVKQIEPASVQLGGASPIAHFFRKVNHDSFLDETFIFRANQITLPRGFTNATLTGQIDNGPNGAPEPFISSVPIFNRDASFYSQAALNATAARRAQLDATVPNFLAQDTLRAAGAAAVPTTPTVQIAMHPAKVKIPTLNHMNANVASSIVAETPRRSTRKSHKSTAMRVSDSRARAMAM
jgi:hypothetical protein